MPHYRYTGDDERVIPGDGTFPSVVVHPGDVVELGDVVDTTRFEPADEGHHSRRRRQQPAGEAEKSEEG